MIKVKLNPNKVIVSKVADIGPKGKEYNVTYLGGLFDFPTDEHWTITFLMEQTPTKSPVHEKIIETFELDKE